MSNTSWTDIRQKYDDSNADGSANGALMQSVIDLIVGATGSPEGLVIAPPGTRFEQGDLARGPLTWRKVFGTDAFGWRREHNNPRMGIVTAPSYRAYGDSMTLGTGTTTDPGFSFPNIINSRVGGTLTNIAVGGTGTLQTVAKIYQNEAVPCTTKLITIMAGFNDLRNSGAAARGYNQLEYNTRAMLAVLFAKTALAASNAALTEAGTWFDQIFVGKANYIGGGAVARKAFLGATKTWAFTGDSLVIGYLGSDGLHAGASATYGPCNITVDGTLIDVIDPNNIGTGVADATLNNQLTCCAKVYRGLGSHAHSVVIAPQSASNVFCLDWVGTLAAPADCFPVLVGMIPRMTTAGYATGGALGSDAIFAAGSLRIANVVAEFAEYPVRSVWPNTRYDLTNGVYTDSVHPNNTGHGQIANAFMDMIQR